MNESGMNKSVNETTSTTNNVVITIFNKMITHKTQTKQNTDHHQ